MYQCPNCNANIRFNIESQKMYCASCGSFFEPAFMSKESDANENEFMEVNVVSCPQCNGEMICDDNEATAFCSYCGASNILTSRLINTHKPKYIIPFKQSKNDCKERYKGKISKNIFAHSAMKDTRNIESFRGIYMPYWVYSFATHGKVNIQGKKTRRKGDYIYTDHYGLAANAEINYQGLNHDAASTFSDRLSEAIAPYNDQDRVAFSSSYMSGFYADVSDIEKETYEAELKKYVGMECLDKFSGQKGAKFYSIDKKGQVSNLHLKCQSNDLLMLPVWFMSTRINHKGNERVTYSVVNGQTGKVVGDVPISVGRYIGVSAVMSLILFVLMQFVLGATLKYKFALGVATAFCGVTWAVFHLQKSSIKDAELGNDDKGWVSVNGKTKKKKASKRSKLNIFLEHVSLLGIVIAAFVFGTDPINDALYYIAAVICMGLALYNIILTVKDFNLTCTRELPQFARKGGDDDANN